MYNFNIGVGPSCSCLCFCYTNSLFRSARSLSPHRLRFRPLCLSGSNEMKGKKTIECLTFDSPNNLFSDYQFFLFHLLVIFSLPRARSYTLQFSPSITRFFPSCFELFHVFRRNFMIA